MTAEMVQSPLILHGLLLRDPAVPPAPGWLAIDQGRIVDLGEGSPPEAPHALDESTALPLICPGFIDAHLHLPQIDAVGVDGLDLLDWLDTTIYPAELRWADPDFARRQVESASVRLLAAGTLGYAAFLSSHFHGYECVVRAGHRLPLRAMVGQALMDRNAPAGLLTGERTRLAVSKRSRVACSVNPRFAVSCSEAMLAEAATRASQTQGALIHTHLAESRRECELVATLFPDAPHYTAVYDRHGLLGERTLLAHALHLHDDEWRLIALRRSVVVHCPTANIFLQSGLFNLGAARQHGVRLALGSDIAAGPDLAMPRIARAMIQTAKVRRMTIDPDAPIPSPAEAWRLITEGNADALGWTDAGRLAIGAAADLLVLRAPVEIDDQLLGRLIYNWDDRWIAHRVLNGRLLA